MLAGKITVHRYKTHKLYASENLISPRSAPDVCVYRRLLRNFLLLARQSRGLSFQKQPEAERQTRGLNAKEIRKFNAGPNSRLGLKVFFFPAGSHRFQRPRQARAWAGVRDVTSFGAACPQLPAPPPCWHLRAEEDCLNLNVYSPTVAGVFVVSQSFSLRQSMCLFVSVFVCVSVDVRALLIG